MTIDFDEYEFVSITQIYFVKGDIKTLYVDSVRGKKFEPDSSGLYFYTGCKNYKWSEGVVIVDQDGFLKVCPSIKLWGGVPLWEEELLTS